jgi:cadmium resistance protein CadD (predicted permease)
VGRGLTAATLVTIAAGGDNLAVYIPLFHEGGAANLLTIATVFVVGEVALTMLVLTAGRHPRARGTMTRLGAIAVPLLLCVVGVLVLLSAGTLSWL